MDEGTLGVLGGLKNFFSLSSVLPLSLPSVSVDAWKDNEEFKDETKSYICDPSVTLNTFFCSNRFLKFSDFIASLSFLKFSTSFKAFCLWWFLRLRAGFKGRHKKSLIFLTLGSRFGDELTNCTLSISVFDAFFCKNDANLSISASENGKSSSGNGLLIFLILSQGMIIFLGLSGRLPLRMCSLGTILIGLKGTNTADLLFN